MKQVVGLIAALGAVGCAGAMPPNAPLATAKDNERTDDAVLVHFVARHDHEQWSVRRADQSFVCAVPCAYWVKPQSGLSVHLDSKPGVLNLEDEIAYAVPDHPPAAPGAEVSIEVDRTHAGGTVGKVVAIPLTFMFGLVGAGATVMGIGGLADGGKTSKASTGVGAQANSPNGNASVAVQTESSSEGTTAAATTLVTGVVLLGLTTACAYWWSRAHQGGLESLGTPQKASRAGFRLEPGGLSGRF